MTTTSSNGFSSAEQEKQYHQFRYAGFEYKYTEPDGTICVEQIERGYDYVRVLQTIRIDPEGNVYKS